MNRITPYYYFLGIVHTNNTAKEQQRKVLYQSVLLRLKITASALAMGLYILVVLQG